MTAFLMTSALQAQAADGTVRLDTPRNLAPGLAAMPPIAAPADDAQRRINAALHQLDATVMKSAARCKGDDGKPGSWDRRVDVPMRGPVFLSYAILDSVYCPGAAHDDSATMAIVYDLRTGRPVDWNALLPPSLTGKLSLSEGVDGTRMVTLSGRTLYAMYLTAYRPRSGDPKKDADDDDCRDAVAHAGFEGAPPAMMAWLDAANGGLVVAFDLPHVVRACADSMTIPAAALRLVGASAELIDAIMAAHAKAAPPP